MQRLRLVLIGFGLLVLFGCKTAPMRMNDVKEGNWRARALIKDREHSRTFIVNLDFNVIRDDNMRIDVTSTLGQPVAALVANNKEVRYFTTNNKRFYVGTPRPEVLKPILSIPLDPRWLQNVLFDETLMAQNWSCKNGTDGFVSECLEQNADLKITWSNRQGAAKTVDIAHPKAEIQMSVKSFTPKVQKSDKLFDLQAPNGFQTFKIR